MKKEITTYALLAALFLLNSCKGFLDKDPIATLDAGSFFQTQGDAIQAINAAYKPLTFSNPNNNFYWAFGTIASDEAITGGDGSRAGLIELDALTHTPRTDEINSFWKLQYSGIIQANLVLDKIQNICQEFIGNQTGFIRLMARIQQFRHKKLQVVFLFIFQKKMLLEN